MPTIPRQAVEPIIEYAMGRWREFEDRNAWRRSSKGNLWRKWDDRTVTVFYRGRRYHWSIADGEEVKFSAATYGDEREAVTALGEALGLSDL